MVRWLKGIVIFIGSIAFLIICGLGIASFYKKEILEQVNSALEETLQADIQIEDADITFLAGFPNISLRLENVRLAKADSLQTTEPFFTARNVLVNIRAYGLIFGEIHFRSLTISDAETFVFRSKAGHFNTEGLQKTNAGDTTSRNGILQLSDGKVVFEHCHFIYADSLKQKFVSFLISAGESKVTYADTVVNFELHGAVDFGGLEFNPEKGSFLKEKQAEIRLQGRYFISEALLVLDPSEVTVHESLVNISGNFNLKEKRTADLMIHSTHLNFQEGLSIIPETLASRLSVMDIEKPFAITVKVHAPLGQDSLPKIDMEFELQENIFRSKGIMLTALSLKGTMTNHVNSARPFNNENSLVLLKNIHGEIDELPFDAEAKLSDFDDLLLELHSKHQLTLAQLNRELDTKVIRFLRGSFKSEFTYKGRLSEYLNINVGKYAGSLKGECTITNGAFQLITRHLTFEKINSLIEFNQDTVRIINLSLLSGVNQMSVSGTMTNYVPFFVQPKEKGNVTLLITSPSIDMESLLVKKKKATSTSRQKSIGKERISDMIDNIFRNLQVELVLKIDKLKNKTFYASHINGMVRMSGTTLEAKNVSMNFGGGQLKMNAVMRDLHKEENPLEVTAQIMNVRINDFFKSFDNFNQGAITHENLEGTVTLSTKFKTRINDDFNVSIPNLRGEASMSVRNGRLINVEAIQSMSNFLFRKRDFGDVRFAQIKGNFEVSNRDLNISRMEIQSTLLSFFLEGKYSLDKRMDLEVQIPLSNLKRRDKDYVPQNIGVDAKVGASVYLKCLTDDAGETNISYILFHKKDDDKGKQERGKGKSRSKKGKTGR